MHRIMNVYKNLCMTVGIIMLIIISANISNAIPTEDWNKTFGGIGWDYAYSMQQTVDGGYVLAGDTSSFVDHFSAWLIKTDFNGNEQWNKTYGYGEAYSVQQTTDGGYVLAGFTSHPVDDTNAWLIKTDSNGNEQWNKTYGYGKAYSVQQTTDGGYVLAGDFLIKTDPNGNEQWNKTYGYGMADSVQQTTDGGYVLAGSSLSSSGYADMWLIKTDSNGNEQWNKTYEYDVESSAYSVQQTTDGGYVLAGNTGEEEVQDMLLIKTDSNGNEQWNKTFGESDDIMDIAHSVQQTTDGGYILAGFTSYPVGDTNALLIKTDSSGNEQWNKTFEGSYANSVRQITDGVYILAGITWPFEAGDIDAWLVKVSEKEMDITPPGSISNLKNINKIGYTNWTWIDPKDNDFSKVMVYIDGVFETNVTKGKQYFKYDKGYKISTHTVDISGNINQTWVNHSNMILN